MLIPIAPGIAFDPRELEESFIRASGPGGQNVNKVSTAVQVRLEVAVTTEPDPDGGGPQASITRETVHDDPFGRTLRAHVRSSRARSGCRSARRWPARARRR